MKTDTEHAHKGKQVHGKPLQIFEDVHTMISNNMLRFTRACAREKR